ncbi:MAG: RluA family pseudouridine synthase [Treponema sp.]|jgi:23S rRNA pseudouridine955/2504/2580 synthase|nr:RluA family pseudouridine synthase [Treponema sp.]
MTILSAGADDGGRRLDRVLRKALPDVPLSRIHRLLREGRVLVDKRPRDAAFRVRAGQEIAVPAAQETGPSAGPGAQGGARTAPGALAILYESPDLLAINKAAGVPVHGPAGSLDALVRAYLAPRLPPSLSFRPGPLHRLDQPTSGIVVFSASLAGARRFSALLREGKIRKQYLALVEGRVDLPGRWEDPLLRDREKRQTEVAAGGKTARTGYTPLAWYPGGKDGCAGGCTLLLLEPETGRRHQIRAQAAFHGHPLAGDSVYGGRPLPDPPLPGPFKPPGPAPPFLLHAWKLTGAGPLPPLEAPPPDYFLAFAQALFGPRALRGKTRP